MAKDSTAVQKLIELAQQKPIDIDLGGLFESDPPSKRAALPPPRPTASHAAMQPSGSPPPLPRTRPSGTQQALPVVAAGTPAPERIDPMTEAEQLFGDKPLPPLPVARPAAPPPVAALPPPRRTMPRPVAAPMPMPPPHVADELPTAPVGLTELEDGDWFQKSEAVERVDDYLLGTQNVEKRRGSAVVAIAAAFGLGLVVAGGYLVYGKLTAKDAKPAVAAGSPGANIAAAAAGAKVRPAPTPVAETAPAPAPTPVEQAAPAPVEQAAPAAAAPTVTPIDQAPAAVAAVAPAPTPAAAAPVAGSLVDVTLKSEPEGVTVMLIDGGGAVKLGKTPTVASLSAGTQHQILFSRDGYSATMATIDPASQTDMMVALVPAPGAAQPAAQVAIAQPAPAAAAPAPTATPIEQPVPAAPAHATAPKHVKASSHADHADHTEARAEARPAHAEHTAPAPRRTATATNGTGTLMIGAKPPCDIIIDGRTTGLTTPQRAIALPPGAHSITLVNRANNIKKSFSVSINAGSPTKVVKDFSSMIKK